MGSVGAFTILPPAPSLCLLSTSSLPLLPLPSSIPHSPPLLHSPPAPLTPLPSSTPLLLPSLPSSIPHSPPLLHSPPAPFTPLLLPSLHSFPPHSSHSPLTPLLPPLTPLPPLPLPSSFSTPPSLAIPCYFGMQLMFYPPPPFFFVGCKSAQMFISGEYLCMLCRVG